MLRCLPLYKLSTTGAFPHSWYFLLYIQGTHWKRNRVPSDLLAWHTDQELVDVSNCVPNCLPRLPREPATFTIFLLRRVEPAASASISCRVAVRPCPAPNMSLIRQTRRPVGIYCLWSNPTWTNGRRISVAASTRLNWRGWRAGQLSRAS